MRHHEDMATPGSLTAEFEATKGLLCTVQRKVKDWAIRQELWHDSGFQDSVEYLQEAPGIGGCYLTCGSLGDVIELVHKREAAEVEAEFVELLSQYGFRYEAMDYSTTLITGTDDDLSQQLLRYDRWNWIKHLFSSRMLDIHAEVFEYFKSQPEAMHLLGWREFEEFLGAVFRNQGYYTEMGPGTGDEGVDIRLFVSEATPELVTFVQAKRFRKKPVTLDAVASLLGVSVLGSAQMSIFATSSRFLPSAQRFARDVETKANLPPMELADGERIAEWCGSISETLDRYLAGMTCQIPTSFRGASGPLQGKIVHASWGSTMCLNTFCIVEHEFPHEVVLRKVGSKIVQGSILSGYEVADLSRPSHEGGERFIAYKSVSGLQDLPSFWGDGKRFYEWDGTPQTLLCD